MNRSFQMLLVFDLMICIGIFSSSCSYLTERQGPEGKQGELGGQGVQGLTSLVNLSDELPGANCTAGGKRVDTGIDSNSDGILGTDEVTDTKYVCHGDQGIEGPPGLACWDTNQSGTCDTIPEDLNNDGICSALDCMGPLGTQGPEGPQGPQGGTTLN